MPRKTTTTKTADAKATTAAVKAMTATEGKASKPKAKNGTTTPLPFKVRTEGGELIAKVSDPITAAMIVGGFGNGFTIESRGRTLWTEGAETQPASESYDNVNEVVKSRLKAADDKKVQAAINRLAKLGYQVAKQ